MRRPNLYKQFLRFLNIRRRPNIYYIQMFQVERALCKQILYKLNTSMPSDLIVHSPWSPNIFQELQIISKAKWIEHARSIKA